MSAWDESHWVDIDAEVLNVFAGSETSWIEYRYTSSYVGWRRILGETGSAVSDILSVAIGAKQADWRVRVRVTSGSGPGGLAEITAIQTR